MKEFTNLTIFFIVDINILPLCRFDTKRQIKLKKRRLIKQFIVSFQFKIEFPTYQNLSSSKLTIQFIRRRYYD